MSLSSLHLDAFIEVARQKSFSLAAKKLHITQSALSQRVLNLEQEIGSTLFVRDSSGIRLTDLGQKLLRYCQSKELLETEFLESLSSPHQKSLHGIVRIAAFSTVLRSAVLPVVSSLTKEHSSLLVELKNQEVRDLPALLSSGATDYIFLTQPLTKQGIENHLIGYEENVLIQNLGKSLRDEIYLDHDEEDSTTLDFFKIQGKKLPIFKRSYLDEIYGIIDGVRLGLGRAVVPLHLAVQSKGVEIVPGYKSLKVPVYLSYYSQSFYTELQKEVIRRLTEEIPNYLAKK